MPGYDFKVYRWGKSYWTAAWPNGELKSDRFEHTFTVPDGMWVKQFHRPVFDERILGKPEALDLGIEFGSQRFRDTLLFSTEPFLVIHVVYGEAPDGGPIDVPHGAYLARAQQVHKGQLGQYVPIELPLVAREAPSIVHPWTSKRDRKRGYIGWVRLTDAAEMAKMSIDEFVLDHWLFVEARDRSYYAPEYRDVRLEMVYAPRREIIHKQVVDSALKPGYTRTEFEAMASAGTDWSNYWIRRGFARTVLLLQQFGWNKTREQQLLGDLQPA